MSNTIQRLSVAAFAAVMALLAAPSVQAKNVCGGIAGIGCSHGQYCFFAKGTCHIPDYQGVCKVRPDRCTREYRPVCGCDGKNYGNPCAAAAAGVSVLHDGKCRERLKAPTKPIEPEPGDRLRTPGRPRVCGGIAGIGCRRGEYCYREPGACRIMDGQGICKRRPRGCHRDYRPVCGCDGKTYPNSCVAASRGVNVLYKGKCRKRPRRERLRRR